MKKLLLLTGAMLLLLITSDAATDQTTFINKVGDAIYFGIQSGKLTKREVRVLHNELSIYEKVLWKYEANGKLSRRERKKLRQVENDFNKKLDIALRNQEGAYGAKKRAKAKVNKARKRNKRPICRMPERSQKDNKY